MAKSIFITGIIVAGLIDFLTDTALLDLSAFVATICLASVTAKYIWSQS